MDVDELVIGSEVSFDPIDRLKSGKLLIKFDFSRANNFYYDFDHTKI